MSELDGKCLVCGAVQIDGGKCCDPDCYVHDRARIADLERRLAEAEARLDDIPYCEAHNCDDLANDSGWVTGDDERGGTMPSPPCLVCTLEQLRARVEQAERERDEAIDWLGQLANCAGVEDTPEDQAGVDAVCRLIGGGLRERDEARAGWDESTRTSARHLESLGEARAEVEQWHEATAEAIGEAHMDTIAPWQVRQLAQRLDEARAEVERLRVFVRQALEVDVALGGALAERGRELLKETP